MDKDVEEDAMTFLFANRADAGKRLAARLKGLDPANSVVVALPRGGVAIAAEICAATGAPLELVLVRKIGAPGQPELAVGAVCDGAATHWVVNREVADAFGLSDADVRALGARELAEIERRRLKWFGARPPLSLFGKTAVLVDDGVATGATMRVALTAARAGGAARLVLALPVAPAETLAELSALADETVCLATPHPFHAVGSHFADFPQLGDADVADALERFAPRRG